MPSTEPITAIVLAGGRSRRMGGVDKGLQPLAGRALIQHVIDRIAPQVASVVINANRNRETYAALGYPVVDDPVPDYPGPLAGLLASQSLTRSDWLLTVPCDAPLLPHDLVARLAAAVQRGDRLLSVRAEGRVQAAVLLAHRSEIDAAAAFLARGERRVRDFLAQRDARLVEFEDEASGFININTPEQLQELERLLRS